MADSKIKLPSGDIAKVSKSDMDSVSGYKWYVRTYPNSKYVRSSEVDSSKKTVLMHHVILGKPPKGYVVDHINGNGLDNRRENLRFVTRSQNAMNARGKINSKTAKGVSYCNKHKKYRARITKDYKTHFIGYFETENQAVAAYNSCANKMFSGYWLPSEVKKNG